MERVEEFSRDGKNFIYMDFSGFRTTDDYNRQIELIKTVISKHPWHSLYTIVNIENVRFDSAIKEVLLKFIKYNRPYVKCAVITGIDGIKKMMVNTMVNLTGRKNVFFTFTKERAIELALQQE